MKKRWYIITIVLVVLGVIVGGFVENKKVLRSFDKMELSSDVPILFNITEQEVEAREKLVHLFEEYGRTDERPGVRLSNDQKEVLAMLPKGCSVEDTVKYGNIMQITYKLGAVTYDLLYSEEHVQKGMTLMYNGKKYFMINTDNKEFNRSRLEE